jgi:hypothetical protein
MQEKTLKKYNYLIKKALQTPFTQKIRKKFWNPKPKSKAKIEDKQKIMTHLESVHLHFTPTRKIV